MSEPRSMEPADAEAAPVRGRGLAVAALWIGWVALALLLALVIPYLATNSGATVVVFVLALAAAVVGIVLASRARRGERVGRRIAGWALASALFALVVDLVLVAVFAIGMASTRVDRVVLQGQGEEGVIATYSDGALTREGEQWPASGWSKFNTKSSWVELTIEAPADAVDRTVACQIIWNDETVVEEQSDSGSVTCRYDR